MKPKHSIINRISQEEAHEEILSFFKNNNRMHIAQNSEKIPIQDFSEYRYVGDEQILILSPLSRFLCLELDNTLISGLIEESNYTGAKTTKRSYGTYECHSLPLEDKRLINLAKKDKFVKKMLTHGAKFYNLTLLDATVYLSKAEVFTIDQNNQVTYSGKSLSGKPRFENSRHVVMQYTDREVIFNVVVENDTYYTLTRADSRKMKHISKGGRCMILDGKNNHFETSITILEDSMVQEVYDKLKATNNLYFKDTKKLKALAFSKES